MKSLYDVVAPYLTREQWLELSDLVCYQRNLRRMGRSSSRDFATRAGRLYSEVHEWNIGCSRQKCCQQEAIEKFNAVPPTRVCALKTVRRGIGGIVSGVKKLALKPTVCSVLPNYSNASRSWKHGQGT